MISSIVKDIQVLSLARIYEIKVIKAMEVADITGRGWGGCKFLDLTWAVDRP